MIRQDCRGLHMIVATMVVILLGDIAKASAVTVFLAAFGCIVAAGFAIPMSMGPGQPAAEAFWLAKSMALLGGIAALVFAATATRLLLAHRPGLRAGVRSDRDGDPGDGDRVRARGGGAARRVARKDLKPCAAGYPGHTSTLSISTARRVGLRSAMPELEPGGRARTAPAPTDGRARVRAQTRASPPARATSIRPGTALPAPAARLNGPATTPPPSTNASRPSACSLRNMPAPPPVTAITTVAPASRPMLDAQPEPAPDGLGRKRRRHVGGHRFHLRSQTASACRCGSSDRWS